MIEELAKTLSGIDNYLLDQVMKGRISASTKILDAGCGRGRNALALERFGCKNITAFDSNELAVDGLETNSTKILTHISSIEDYTTKESFDFIICNAVLHFAMNHEHFHTMIQSLCNCMHPKSVLFIRMTSDFAVNGSYMPNENGIASLADGTERYLLDATRLHELNTIHHLQLVEPLKTVNVNNLRSMSTLILQKS